MRVCYWSIFYNNNNNTFGISPKKKLKFGTIFRICLAFVVDLLVLKQESNGSVSLERYRNIAHAFFG